MVCAITGINLGPFVLCSTQPIKMYFYYLLGLSDCGPSLVFSYCCEEIVQGLMHTSAYMTGPKRRKGAGFRCPDCGDVFDRVRSFERHFRLRGKLTQRGDKSLQTCQGNMNNTTDKIFQAYSTSPLVRNVSARKSGSNY